ncbi:MAG: hypothetical protein MUF25_09900, partial [Pirellulaceae bacterium]|nr:hypothetical protein [Pirellulaceae bacterium]
APAAAAGESAAKSKPAEKADPKKMSTAEILAAARAKKAGGATAAPVAAEAGPAAKPAAKKLSTAEILALCRQAGGAKGD